MDKFSKRKSVDSKIAEDYYQCGINAAIFVGALGTACSVALLLILLRMHYGIVHIVFSLIVIVSYLLILIAQHTKVPNLCWLFLIFNPICMGLICVGFIYPSLTFLVGVDRFHSLDAAIDDLSRLVALIELGASVTGLLVMAYFQSIIYRAFGWMRKRRIQLAATSVLPC